MPNPTTGVLDDFNRPDENPVTGGGRWITPTPNSGANVQVISNEAGTTNSSGGSEVYWLPQRFAADCEVFVTCTVKPATGDWFYLNLRIDNNDTASAFVSSYFLVLLALSGTDSWQIRKLTTSGQTTLATVALEYSAGDRVWFTAIGSTFTGYHDTGSGFTQVITATDATYNNSGFISMQMKDAVVRLDDFGGGSIAPDFPRQIYRRL